MTKRWLSFLQVLENDVDYDTWHWACRRSRKRLQVVTVIVGIVPTKLEKHVIEDSSLSIAITLRKF
jgi:hypothetical protein